MRAINSKLTPELENKIEKKKSVASSNGFQVKDYSELVEITAQLAYLNSDYLLFYRGQNKDYKNKDGNTTLYPSIYREYMNEQKLMVRFGNLKYLGNKLTKAFEKEKVEGLKDIKRKEYVRWSILQHYELCETPLLDVTQSLRVACTFALLDNKNDYGYVYVLGMPYITNSISVNSEQEIVNVRLLSVCPPSALRPYYQEGFLVGTTDITDDYEVKDELDFKNRLIAKFRIPGDGKFWTCDFNQLPRNALYPTNDSIEIICNNIDKQNVEMKYKSDIEEFIYAWADLERSISKISNVQSLYKAIKMMLDKEIIDYNTYKTLNNVRYFRNIFYHNPHKIKNDELIYNLKNIKSIYNKLGNK